MSKTIPTDDQIRLRAYHLWEINARQDGRELDYWLQAALELEDVASARDTRPVVASAATLAANLDRPTRAGGFRRSA